MSFIPILNWPLCFSQRASWPGKGAFSGDEALPEPKLGTFNQNISVSWPVSIYQFVNTRRIDLSWNLISGISCNLIFPATSICTGIAALHVCETARLPCFRKINTFFHFRSSLCLIGTIDLHEFRVMRSHSVICHGWSDSSKSPWKLSGSKVDWSQIHKLQPSAMSIYEPRSMERHSARKCWSPHPGDSCAMWTQSRQRYWLVTCLVVQKSWQNTHKLSFSMALIPFSHPSLQLNPLTIVDHFKLWSNPWHQGLAD